MENSLYGVGFIEKLVSSGYKSPIYAMAEIIDNSVDAEAKNIDIVLVEETKKEGGKASTYISEVFFIDDGNGMTYNQINGCLRFSEGAGTSDRRIGTFGVGLPNSSIYVGRRVEVYSKDKDTGHWNFVFLDLDDQQKRVNACYDEATKKTPVFKDVKLGLDLEKISTIVRWTKIRTLGYTKAETVITHTAKLTGRIYRHVLEDINISFGSLKKGNSDFNSPLTKILPYDPLFLTEHKSQITDLVWKSASGKPKVFFSDSVPDSKEFNTQFHYQKYVAGCIENSTIRPLFQKLDTFWDLPQSIYLNGKKYIYTVRAAFATKSILKPGIREGGKTELGQEFRKKMVGDKDFTGGNISFIRGKREILSGNFGLYSLTTETERFWSIEIEFDSSLDKLLGLDYQKQNISFKMVESYDLGDLLGESENLREDQMQMLLFHQISDDIKTCRKQMLKVLKVYRDDFRDELSAAEKREKGITEDMPEVEPAVFRVLPKGGQWTDVEKTDFTQFLKKKYMSIPEKSIAKQVEKFAKGLHKTVVLYSADETGNLFEIQSIRGKKVTFINTKHKFYTNIIEPLKENNQLNVFTSAIEMLICTYAYEMETMILDNADNEMLLTQYLRRISDRLEGFIHESQISIDTSYWKNQTQDTDDID